VDNKTKIVRGGLGLLGLGMKRRRRARRGRGRCSRAVVRPSPPWPGDPHSLATSSVPDQAAGGIKSNARFLRMRSKRRRASDRIIERTELSGSSRNPSRSRRPDWGMRREREFCNHGPPTVGFGNMARLSRQLYSWHYNLTRFEHLVSDPLNDH
jgi:hypothetical protein